MPNWIRVNDRLPEESGNVIVYCDYGNHGYMAMVNFSVKYQKFNVYDFFEADYASGFDAFNDVTHWMPMPKPPKEET